MGAGAAGQRSGGCATSSVGAPDGLRAGPQSQPEFLGRTPEPGKCQSGTRLPQGTGVFIKPREEGMERGVGKIRRGREKPATPKYVAKLVQQEEISSWGLGVLVFQAHDVGCPRPLCACVHRMCEYVCVSRHTRRYADYRTERAVKV